MVRMRQTILASLFLSTAMACGDGGLGRDGTHDADAPTPPTADVPTLSGDTASSAEPLLSGLHGDPVGDFVAHFESAGGGVFRGEPAETWEQMQFLRSQGIRTILSVENHWTARRTSVAREAQMAQALGMQLIWRPMSPVVPLNRDYVADTVAVLGDARYLPLYLSCKFGRERTGFVIALHRVVNQHWSPEMAHQEMTNNGFRPYLVPILHQQFHQWTADYQATGTFRRGR